MPATELFSWKSPTARQLGLAPGTLGDDELLRLMADEPRLIRRPVALTGDRVIVGANFKALATMTPAAGA